MSYRREGEEGPCDQCRTQHKQYIKMGRFYHDSGWFQCDFHRQQLYLTSSAHTEKAPLKDIEEAKRIVVGVWVKLTDDWEAKTPMAPWMMKIKDGYKYDRRFYRALQTMVADGTPEWWVELAGAPASICDKEGVLLKNHLGVPKRFVFFELIDRKTNKRWMPS